MARRLRAPAGLSLLALCAPAWAESPPPPEPEPSAELLLFLAEFKDAAGNDIDPIALAEQAEPGRDAEPAARDDAPHEQEATRDDDEAPPPQ